MDFFASYTFQPSNLIDFEVVSCWTKLHCE